MAASRGFTLIELLIVVAIIGILAAIAIPNFLQAQVRAKVARAVSEVRNVSMGVEQYRIDNNVYPFCIDSRGWPWYVTDCVTTPINYISQASALIDPFRLAVTPWGDVGERYRYINMQSEEEGSCPGCGSYNCWPPCPFPGPYATLRPPCKSNALASRFRLLFGEWRISSAGPDQTASFVGPSDDGFFGELVIYDPTNGTVSRGDVARSQKYAQVSESS